MRPDFKHLLTERERAFGHRSESKKGFKKAVQQDEAQDYEDWAPGRKVGIKKDFSGESKKTKYLNENLTPLTNFLRGSVGRVWDEVYSEISEACPNDSAVSGHIYQHLWQFVERSPRYDDKGNVYAASGWFSDEPLISRAKYPKFYVNQSGILVECQRADPRISWAAKEAKERAKYERRMSNGNLAVKIKGFWYEAQLRPFPFPKLRAPDEKHDTYWYEEAVVSDEYVKHSEWWRKTVGSTYPLYSTVDKWETTRRQKLEKYYGEAVYCHALKQLNSKELRQNNLKNNI